MYSRLAKGEFCKYCNFVSKLGYVDVSQRICCFLWGSSSALFHTIIPKLFHVPCASAASSAWCMCKSTWSFPVSMLRIKFISWPGSAINFIICFARVEGDSSNIPFIQNKRNGQWKLKLGANISVLRSPMSHHPNDSPRQSQVQVEDRNAKLVTRQIVIFVLQLHSFQGIGRTSISWISFSLIVPVNLIYMHNCQDMLIMIPWPTSVKPQNFGILRVHSVYIYIYCCLVNIHKLKIHQTLPKSPKGIAARSWYSWHRPCLPSPPFWKRKSWLFQPHYLFPAYFCSCDLLSWDVPSSNNELSWKARWCIGALPRMKHYGLHLELSNHMCPAFWSFFKHTPQISLCRPPLPLQGVQVIINRFSMKLGLQDQPMTWLDMD